MMVGDKGGGVYHSLKVYGNNSEWTSINFWPVFPPRPTGLKNPILFDKEINKKIYIWCININFSKTRRAL
jgi:hypothetical protein